ncbi:SRPBCC family protein [Oleiharenicola lentus]|uniref:SRPBCC family protein n=1 Tax=Oleiharenicola lentus TaxID=2508720 RepID=UPI003F667330
MKTAFRILVLLLGLVLFAGIALYFVGMALPERHTQIASITMHAKRSAVWSVITDYEKMPEWWPDVKAVRFEKRPDGEIWTWEQGSDGEEIAFRTIAEKAPEKLVREIAGDNLPFGGAWTFELSDVTDGYTRLTITEDGFVKPPVFRAIAKYFIGHDKTMKSFINSLEKRIAAQK